MPVVVDIKNNISSIKARLALLLPATRKHVKSELDLELISILRDSKTKPPRVPVDTGALQSTGHVEPAEISPLGNIKASISYGGVAAAPFNKIVDYAELVHDNVGGRIKHYKRPGSGPKFLETHVNSHRESLRQRQLDAMRRARKEALPNS